MTESAAPPINRLDDACHQDRRAAVLEQIIARDGDPDIEYLLSVLASTQHAVESLCDAIVAIEDAASEAARQEAIGDAAAWTIAGRNWGPDVVSDWATRRYGEAVTP